MATAKLTKEQEKELQDSINLQKVQIELKKEKTGDPNWKPVGEDHGAGFIPEPIWKQINPDSSEKTDVTEEEAKEALERGSN